MPPAPVSPVRLRIEFDQASDPGRDPNKQVNEDSCGYAETKFGHLVVLCDGMGGHYGGKEASRLAIATIFEAIEQAPATLAPVDALKSAIEEAGRRVYRLGGPPENRTRPGSTVVAMVLHDRGVDVAHVGDSRAYCIRSGQIYPLTRDHSMVQGMIDAGLLTEAQAIGHPDANKITRALGMKPEAEVEVRPEPMELFVGDVLLMSSDGLTDLVLPADILSTARDAFASGGVPNACRALVALANERGGPDNITVQIARVTDVPKAHTTIPEAPAPSGPGAASARVPVSSGQPDYRVGPTAPDPGHAPAPQAVPGAWPGAAPSAQAGGQPLAPTAPNGAPQPVVPTLLETPPASNAAWSPRPAAQGGLAAFRIDGGPNALPLPPSSGGPSNGAGAPPAQPYAPPGAVAPTAVGVSPTAVTPPPAAGYSLGPATSYPSPSAGSGRPSHGGLVFLIIGMSAVIAVLLILVIWALFFRA
jgi:protein phosphatase